MSMGIVSDKEFDSELKHIREGSNSTSDIRKEAEGEVIDLPSKGRGVGNIEVPNGLRQIIGDTAISEGRQEAVELARNFGISPSSVSAYTQGATSTVSYDERPNQELINKTKDRIAKRARGKLMSALRHITDEKLGGAKARDLAGIAKDMSAVVRNMEPEGPKSPTTSGPQFIFYSPQFRKEEHYDVVTAKE